MTGRPLNIPVILGTVRKMRRSEQAARFIHDEVAKREGVETQLIDIAKLRLPVNDAGEEAQDPSYGEAIKKADALIIVSPEYNHSFPGMLKHVLDTALSEYVHKPAGIVGVTSHSFGGTRMIENMLSVFRELGLVAIFWDINFFNVGDAFDESGRLLDQAFIPRTDKFLKELIWMAKTLRYGREQVALG